MQKLKVSNEAFIQEIENWQLTLNRENKKLKSLLTKITNNLHANELNILITQIQGEIIKYRKYKDPKKLERIDMIEEYNQFSRKFMDLMETIGNFVDKVDGHINQQATLNLERSHNSKENISELGNNYKFEHYHQQKASKIEPTMKKTKKGNTLGKNDQTMFSSKYCSRKTNINNKSLSRGAKNSEEYDSTEIKFQLKQIKSMMTQIQNEIKYHNHDDIETQLTKLQHNNRRMNLELKGVREDNQYIMNRMQKLKQELNSQIQIQNQMIAEFEGPQPRVSLHGRSRRKKHSQKSMSHNQSYNTQNEELSEWVKVRI